MQKLVTLYLDVAGMDCPSGIRFTNADLHGQVQEHLAEYLSKGWRVTHLSCLPVGTGGWVVVTLADSKAMHQS